MAPLQLSSFVFAQTSVVLPLTVGSSSSQSVPSQCTSGSPSSSTSRGTCVQLLVGSSQASIVHGSPSEQPIGSPGRHPSFRAHRSRPSQYTVFRQLESSG